jgi:hypothetical protein
MNEATVQQLRSLYRICYVLTNVMFQPIHIIRIDERTSNIFILAGHSEDIEIEIAKDGEMF